MKQMIAHSPSFYRLGREWRTKSSWGRFKTESREDRYPDFQFNSIIPIQWCMQFCIWPQKTCQLEKDYQKDQKDKEFLWKGTCHTK